VSRPLPVTISPRPGESIESWLEHLADANGLTTAQLLTLVRVPGAGTRYLTLAPTHGTVTRLAALARVHPDAVAAGTLATFDGTALDLTGLDPGHRHSYRQVAARGWAPAHGTQVCPACLAQTGTWLVAWRLLLVTACTRHHTVLAAACPSCRRPLRDQQHSPLRAVGAAITCGNPLGAGPTRQCQHDLTTIHTPPADPDVLRTQTRIDTALAGAGTTVLGTAVTARDYLADLRHLTTLLLHLAAQPGAADLAHWTAALTLEAAERTGARGPRWGLRPPTDPALRGAALATADALLACDTVDEAATVLTPWLEATPRTADGTLGWLAGHTVMTPTLTRLVTAARAPHRRLSRHLDTRPENGTAVPTPLHTIPQVMPNRIYRDHLAGAFDSGEHTVRLFASLCLARTHPDVTTWADAAIAVGLPAELGAPTARACSATMRISNDEWAARIRQALAELSGRDFRALEAEVRILQDQRGWFEAWAHHHRPGTRRTSRELAVTWLWVNRAHGHLVTSPGWDGQPTTPDRRCAYRNFETSLTRDQERELTRVGTLG